MRQQPMLKATLFLLVNLLLAWLVYSLHTTLFKVIGAILLIEGIAIFIFRWLRYRRDHTSNESSI